MKTNPPSHLARHTALKGAVPVLDLYRQKNRRRFYESFFSDFLVKPYNFEKKNSFMVKYQTGLKFVKMFQTELYDEPPGRTKTTMMCGFITKSFTSHSKNGRPSVEAKPHKI